MKKNKKRIRLFRLSEEENEKVEKALKKYGITFSKFIRNLINNSI